MNTVKHQDIKKNFTVADRYMINIKMKSIHSSAKIMPFAREQKHPKKLEMKNKKS